MVFRNPEEIAEQSGLHACVFLRKYFTPRIITFLGAKAFWINGPNTLILFTSLMTARYMLKVKLSHA